MTDPTCPEQRIEDLSNECRRLERELEKTIRSRDEWQDRCNEATQELVDDIIGTRTRALELAIEVSKLDGDDAIIERAKKFFEFLS